MTRQEKWRFGFLWFRSWIRAHNKLSEAEQLLGLFHFTLLLALYQSSSSNLHCKLKSTKVTTDLGLDEASSLQLVPIEWEWPEMLRPHVSFTTLGLANAGQKKN